MLREDKPALENVDTVAAFGAFARFAEVVIPVDSEKVSDEAGKLREEVLQTLRETGVEVAYIDLGTSKQFPPNDVTTAVFARNIYKFNLAELSAGFDEAYRACGLIGSDEHAHVIPLFAVQYRTQEYNGGDHAFMIRDLNRGKLSPTAEALRELNSVAEAPSKYRVVAGVAGLTGPGSLEFLSGVDGSGEYGTGAIIVVNKHLTN